MTKHSKYHKKYTGFGDAYQLVLPLEMEGLIPEDDSVRLLSHELEGLEYGRLYKAYSLKGRKPAVDPKTMFKVMVYAYSQNIYSTRKIEQACKRDINFMWLLSGQEAPDHSTIARFRSGTLTEACEDLFYQLIKKLRDNEEVSGETVFIDGTKIEASANKYTFVWKKSINKWEEKMLSKIRTAVGLLNRDYMKSFDVREESRTEDLERICGYLEDNCRERGTLFVSGKGKRKSREQRYLELFRGFLERQRAYDSHNENFKGRNNYCKTDPDATFMHMKDDHMRNAQLKPGYNVQIGVDSEYIVAAEIYQDRNDVWTLVPFLKKMKEKLSYRYPSVTADSGYESEEGYEYLSSEGQKAYIKPQTYEQWKKKSFKRDISKRENMKYDEASDTYTCHGGRRLRPIYIKKQKSRSGYKSEVTVYECEDCAGCPYKDRCTKAFGNKKLYVSKNFLDKRMSSYENIVSETGIRYRMNRSIQVEGAFGVLKNDYGFQRFLLRGKTKVKLEILLLCMGYNINKLHSKIQGERTQFHLFPVKAA